MRHHIDILLNGEPLRIEGADAFQTLAELLRERCGLTGTKIVCAEGDCGACSVLLGRLDGDGRVRYRAVDSCILFPFQLDGAHVVTVEGLGSSTDLSRVQEAMVGSHASQCGFCTPGFVVSLSAICDGAQPVDRDLLRRELTGNLCRCTGYESILDAALQAAEGGGPRLGDRYPEAAIAPRLAAIDGDDVEITARDSDGGRDLRVAVPASLESALDFLAAHDEVCVVAGATDVGVQRNKGVIDPEVFLDLGRVAELSTIGEADGCLAVGAAATWTELEDALGAHFPELRAILHRFGAPQIRHLGTIGGNLVNASPIADSLPFLYVMEATVELAGPGGRRRLPIDELYLGYKQLDMRPDELLVRVHIPLPQPGEVLRLFKMSKRRDLDIASFTAAIRLVVDDERIVSARIAFGAVGPTVLRARRTEEALVGKRLSAALLSQAGDAAVAEISPISDVRGSAEFRATLARRVLAKLGAELEPVHQGADGGQL